MYYVHRDLELEVRYDLSKSDVEFMLQTICRSWTQQGHCLTESPQECGEGDFDGDYPPSTSDRQSPAPPASGSRQQSLTGPTPPPLPSSCRRSPTDPAPPPPASGAPTDLVPPSGTASKVRLLSTHHF